MRIFHRVATLVDSPSFGDLLRAARQTRGMTQEGCAARAGIGVRTLRDLEHGRAYPQQATLDLLLAALVPAPAERARLAAASGRSDSTPNGNKPLPPRPQLIGRDDEVEALLAAWDRARLITLVGVAGVGKTSLALEVAHLASSRCTGGASAIAVTEVSTDSDVLATIAAAFNIARVDELPARLAGREALLLVDSAERAAWSTAAALRRLIAQAPTLRVIVTSRHRLDLPDESVWLVTPLEVPASQDSDPGRFPAVALFRARFEAVRREPVPDCDVAVIAELVRRLGGLPLALELAAARGRELGLREILDRYKDRVLDLDGESGEGPPMTLRDAIGASYRLLDPVEKLALRRLASFQHCWSLELAEPLLGATAGIPDEDVVDLLNRLVGLGLVHIRATGSVRFRLLDVVRDFATEQSRVEYEDADASAIHARIIAGYVARVTPDLAGAMLLDAVRRIDDVASDVRAAIGYASVHEPGTALRLAANLPRWWRFRGHDREGRDVLRRLLADPRSADASPAVRAWAHLGVCVLAAEHGEGWTELASAGTALETFVALDDVGGQLAARTQLVALYHGHGAYAMAQEHGEAALALATSSGRTRDVLVASTNLTWHDIRTGKLDAARRRLIAVQKLAAEVGDHRLRALAHANLAEVARLDGQYADAVATGRAAIALLEQLGDPRHRCQVYTTIGLALAQSGHPGEARRIIAEISETEYAGGGLAMIEAYLALAEGDRRAAIRWFSAARAALTDQHDVRDVVEALVGLAAATEDATGSALVRVELLEICQASAVQLLPRDQALLDAWGAPAWPSPTAGGEPRSGSMSPGGSGIPSSLVPASETPRPKPSQRFA